jgi:hypothetical protein
MPLFMWFYIAGLCLALGVGIIMYFVVGGHAMPLFRALFGARVGHLWGRTFRLTLVASAMLGGLATTWHGCEGYSDYGRVAQDKGVMLQKTTEQVASAMSYAVFFLIFVATLGATMYSVLYRTPAIPKDKTNKVPQRPT